MDYRQLEATVMGLGYFNGFPHRGRYESIYRFGFGKADLTRALLASLRNLNRTGKRIMLSVAGRKGEIIGSRKLYVKVGWDDTFVAYGPSRFNLLCETTATQPQTTVDFALIVKYAYPKGQRGVPLRSDEYWMRFNIGEGKFELQLHHPRGIRRMGERDVAVLLEEYLISYLRQANLPLDLEIIAEAGR